MTTRTAYAVSSTPSSDGTVLSYRLVGDPSRRPLVLLHGWAQSSGAWGSSLLSELAEEFYVVAPDLRGHGHSEVAANGYDSPEQWADDVDVILNAAGVAAAGSGGKDQRAILLGWSYGGIVLSDYLSQRGSDRVAGIVLCGAVSSISGSAGGAVGPAMLEVVAGAASEDPKRAISALASFGSAMLRGSDGPGQQRLFGQALATEPRVRAAMLARRVDNDATLGGLDLPALVLHGAEDGVVLPSAGRANAEMIPHARYVEFAGCAHAPFLEDRERFVTELRRFAEAL